MGIMGFRITDKDRREIRRETFDRFITAVYAEAGDDPESLIVADVLATDLRNARDETQS